MKQVCTKHSWRAVDRHQLDGCVCGLLVELDKTKKRMFGFVFQPPLGFLFQSTLRSSCGIALQSSATRAHGKRREHITPKYALSQSGKAKQSQTDLVTFNGSDDNKHDFKTTTLCVCVQSFRQGGHTRQRPYLDLAQHNLLNTAASTRGGVTGDRLRLAGHRTARTQGPLSCAELNDASALTKNVFQRLHSRDTQLSRNVAGTHQIV